MDSAIRFAIVIAVALVATAGASSAEANAWPTEPTLPLAATTLGPEGRQPVTVADGSGGVYVIWSQNVAGDFDLFAQHYLADGTRAPGWAATGLVVCGVLGSQANPVAVSDGSGGFVVAWEDLRAPAQGLDVFVQRIQPNGDVFPGWPAGGRLLGGVNKDEKDLAIVPDGTGGAIVAWELVFAIDTDYDVFAGRVNGAGSVVFSSVVSNPVGLQLDVAAIPDGAGGAYLAWRDDLNTRIAAQRISAAGSFAWTSSHVTVWTAAAGMWDPQLAPDATGGLYVAWGQGGGVPSTAGYVERLDAAGNLLWPSPHASAANMLLVGTGLTDFHVCHEIAADGLGGVYSAYQEGAFSAPWPVRVTRVLPGGVRAAGWPDGGIVVFSNSLVTVPFVPGVHLGKVQSDGAGGAYVAVSQPSASSTADARVVRVSPNGSFAPGWPYDGIAVGSSSTLAGVPALTALGDGNAFLAWESVTGNPKSEILANRIDRFGYLGDPSPALASVRDVTNDQGGHVRVSWTRSWLDSDPSYLVGTYRVWRQLPAGLAAMRTARGAGLAASFAEPGLDRGAIVATPSGATTLFWELAGTQAAQALPGYSMTIETAGDSTAAGNPLTLFMVTALHSYMSQFWNSAPDSGYSVDNLAPATPAPFAGSYTPSSGTFLTWGANAESDLAGYRLYRGTDPSFVPSPDNRIAQQATTGFHDLTSGGTYKLSAYDIHGNESLFAVLVPGGTVGVGPTPPVELALHAVSPNPAAGAMRVGFALPRETPVRLDVYDARGRRVRTLADGTWPAGEQSASWDGRDASGARAGAGLYFVRLTAEGRTFTRRMARVP